MKSGPAKSMFAVGIFADVGCGGKREVTRIRMLRWMAIFLVSGALVGGLGLIRHWAEEPLEAGGAAPGRTDSLSDPAASPARFASNEECQPCHAEIYAEWQEDEHSRAWFNEPLLIPDPKRTECNNCHAPLPVLETGLDQLPVIRSDRFHEGVGCIECHWNVDHVEGPRPGSEAACNPRFNGVFTKSDVCASCHAPHGTLDEWRASEAAAKGQTCQVCHMPLVDAPSVTGGPPQRRRSHRMRMVSDPEFLREAVRLEVSVEGARVRVALENYGAGHNVPGEIFNREMFLTTTVRDADGNEVASHRESFKTVRREQRASEATTQLEPGERREFTYDLLCKSGRVEVFVGYKRLLYLPDAVALPVWEREVSFGD